MRTLHHKIKSKIIENLPFCIKDIFFTYRPLYFHTFRQYLKLEVNLSKCKVHVRRYFITLLIFVFV